MHYLQIRSAYVAAIIILAELALVVSNITEHFFDYFICAQKSIGILSCA
ncbi:MAG: hypothetical protein ACD_56C00004G0001 [uncultured bacterium]|nr:MAG: hypothetical protein ACD_56C00004G0001 [uncultured bacterium]